MIESDVREIVSGSEADIEPIGDKNVVGKVTIEDGSALEKGEIVSPHFLRKAANTFAEEFGETTDAVLSVMTNDDGFSVLALRPLDGDDTEAVVLATKILPEGEA